MKSYKCDTVIVNAHINHPEEVISRTVVLPPPSNVINYLEKFLENEAYLGTPYRQSSILRLFFTV